MAGVHKLTDKAIKQAQPKERPYKLPDGGSMYLQVMPNGAKYWRLKYRYGGKERAPLALGVYPVVSLSTAREKARIAKERLAEGTDPGETKKQAKLAKQTAIDNTFEAIALEWLALKKPQWSQSSITRTESQLKNKLFPWLGRRPVGDITAQELLAVLKRIESKGTIETAHRVKYTAGQIFRYAIATNRAAHNPVPNLSDALATAKEKHFASITEPQEVGKLLVAMDGFNGTPVVRAALLLSPLLFVRPGELRQMQWADVDLKTAEWRYLVTKTNSPNIVPLCRQALEILRDLQSLTGRGRYVFPSARGGSRPLSENGVRTALRTLGYTNEQMTPHGFRAMARTILDEVLDYRMDWIEHQLAHAVKDANGRAYNRTAHLEGRKQMMQGWADYLDQLKTKTLN